MFSYGSPSYYSPPGESKIVEDDDDDYEYDYDENTESPVWTQSPPWNPYYTSQGNARKCWKYSQFFQKFPNSRFLPYFSDQDTYTYGDIRYSSNNENSDANKNPNDPNDIYNRNQW